MLTPKQISIMLHVDRDTVVNWHLRGIRIKRKSRTIVVRLQAGKKGGRWLISPRSLATFLSRLDYPGLQDLPLDTSSHTSKSTASDDCRSAAGSHRE